MAQIKLELLTQAKKETASLKRKATIGLKKGNFPINQNFICPYCSYVSKKTKQGSARIYSNGLFICFVCDERRRT